MDYSNGSDSFTNDDSRKKVRLWVFIAQILTTLVSSMNPPIPLHVDNGLLGVEFWFEKEASTEVVLLCHLDSYVAMNTWNLQVHQQMMTAPHLVAEYIQYDDSTPF